MPKRKPGDIWLGRALPILIAVCDGEANVGIDQAFLVTRPYHAHGTDQASLRPYQAPTENSFSSLLTGDTVRATRPQVSQPEIERDHARSRQRCSTGAGLEGIRFSDTMSTFVRCGFGTV